MTLKIKVRKLFKSYVAQAEEDKGTWYKGRTLAEAVGKVFARHYVKLGVKIDYRQGGNLLAVPHHLPMIDKYDAETVRRKANGESPYPFAV